MDLSERHKRLHVYVDFVLNIAKTKLNRKEFCELHNMQASKLSRILNRTSSCNLELFDYICQDIGYVQYLYFEDTLNINEL